MKDRGRERGVAVRDEEEQTGIEVEAGVAVAREEGLR